LEKKYFRTAAYGQLILTRKIQAAGIENMFCRRSVWQKLGGLDPAFGEWADADFCLRAGQAGLAHLFTPYMYFTYAKGSAITDAQLLTNKNYQPDRDLLHQHWCNKIKQSGLRNMNCKRSGTGWSLL
jgi:GT2 family glycosyltransferase